MIPISQGTFFLYPINPLPLPMQAESSCKANAIKLA